MKTLKFNMLLLFLAVGHSLMSQNEPLSKSYDVDSTTVVKVDFQTAALIEVLPSTSKQIKIEANIDYTDWFGKDLNERFKILHNQKGNTLTINSDIEDFTFNYLARSQSSKETRNKLMKMYKRDKFEGLISDTKITIYIPTVKELYVKSQLAKINIKGVQNSIFIETNDDIELSAPKGLEATYILSSLSGEVISEFPEVKPKQDLQVYEMIAKKNSQEVIKPKTIISLKTLEKIILKEETTIVKDENKILQENKDKRND